MTLGKLNNQTLVFSREALRDIDMDSVNEYQIPSIVLMENAARGAAEIIVNSTNATLWTNIVILCGSGNNGGDGYALARHLTNRECAVTIVEISKPKSEDAVLNSKICREMGIKLVEWEGMLPTDPTIIIDAIFGTGLDRNIDGKYAGVIESVNKNSAPCVALDIPSGLDCDSGEPLGCCIKASMTISFVGTKKGFFNENAQRFLGEVIVSDIGCPNSLLNKYASVST
jgi:NAD(P)H-hydrate epimerase